MGEYAEYELERLERYHLFQPNLVNNSRKRKRMANKEQFIVVRGTLDWAKIVGNARPHTGLPKYDKGPKWSVDVTPNEASREVIKKAGIGDKLKTPKKGPKERRKESFLPLSVLENRPDGKKNGPPKIESADGRPWDDSEIGNGSIADLKIKVVDYGDTQGAYLQKVRILKHIPYESGDTDFEPLSEDDEFFGATVDEDVKKADTSGEAGNPDDLDDDIPF